MEVRFYICDRVRTDKTAILPLSTSTFFLHLVKQRLTQRRVDRNGDDALVVAFRLLRHQLDHALRQVDLRPVEAATVTEAQSGVDADEKESMPFRRRGEGRR